MRRKPMVLLAGLAAITALSACYPVATRGGAYDPYATGTYDPYLDTSYRTSDGLVFPTAAARDAYIRRQARRGVRIVTVRDDRPIRRTPRRLDDPVSVVRDRYGNVIPQPRLPTGRTGRTPRRVDDPVSVVRDRYGNVIPQPRRPTGRDDVRRGGLTDAERDARRAERDARRAEREARRAERRAEREARRRNAEQGVFDDRPLRTRLQRQIGVEDRNAAAYPDYVYSDARGIPYCDNGAGRASICGEVDQDRPQDRAK